MEEDYIVDSHVELETLTPLEGLALKILPKGRNTVSALIQNRGGYTDAHDYLPNMARYVLSRTAEETRHVLALSTLQDMDFMLDSAKERALSIETKNTT